MMDMDSKGTISGWCIARCRKCKCRFEHYHNYPFFFVDQEVVGTCDDCINERDHDCYDELTENVNGGFLFMGRKTFKKKKEGGK